MVFKDVVGTGVEAAVGKDPRSDVVVEDGREGWKGDLVGKGGTEGGGWAGGHVDVEVGGPMGDGVVDVPDERGVGRETREGTSAESGGYESDRDGAEGRDVLDRHYKSVCSLDAAGPSPPFCRRLGDSDSDDHHQRGNSGISCRSNHLQCPCFQGRCHGA